MAPELLYEEGYNCSADIFSVGVIFYIMLTGRSLFKGNSPKEILRENMNCACEYPERYFKNVSKEGLDLLKKMLEID